MISACCESECYETEGWFICKACGAKKTVQPDEFTTNTEWKTAEGSYVRIREMSDHHLLSAIRVLRNMSPLGTTFKCEPERRRAWINVMANEAYARGLAIDPLTDEEESTVKHE